MELTSGDPDYLMEKTYTGDSGWLFELNGEFWDTGLSAVTLNDGDVVHLTFALFPFSMEYVNIVFSLG